MGQRHCRETNCRSRSSLHLGCKAIRSADDEHHTIAFAAPRMHLPRKIDRCQIFAVLIEHHYKITWFDRSKKALSLKLHQLRWRLSGAMLRANFLQIHTPAARKTSKVPPHGFLRPIGNVLTNGKNAHSHYSALCSGLCARCGIRCGAHSV